MRVTNGMMADRVIFNLQRSLQRFMSAQIDVSSGRRINRASDDPIGTVRDLDFRRELSQIEQFQKNIRRAISVATTYDSDLGDVSNALITVNEIVVAMADGIFDADQRNASATEVESIIDKILLVANGRFEGRQLFSGLRTKTLAFERGANGFVYKGDQGRIQYEIESGLLSTVNMIGSDVFLKQLSVLGSDGDVNVAVNGFTLLSELKNGSGIDQAPGTFTITDETNAITSTIDISAATTLDDVLMIINTQLVADGINNFVAKLGLENNNILIDVTNTGEMFPTTLVTAFNDGNGIDQTPGTFRITDGAGIDFVVDISTATTAGDIIGLTNTALAVAGVTNVTMSRNADLTGFAFTDLNVPPLGLTIEDIASGSTTAADLGINGSVGAKLDGSALNPQIRFNIAETTGSTAADLGIRKEITADFSGNDLDPILTTTSLVSDLNLRSGISFGVLKLAQGERVVRLDLSLSSFVTIQDILDAFNNSGLDITATINANGRGIQIVNNDQNRSFIIEDDDNGRTSKDLSIYGSSDMLGSLQIILNALRSDDQEGIGLLKQNIEDGIGQILDQRAIVGARAKQLETTQLRLFDSEVSFTRLLSDVEDADLTKVLTDLASRETSYQSALLASARIIQPSLLDFLR